MVLQNDAKKHVSSSILKLLFHFYAKLGIFRKPFSEKEQINLFIILVQNLGEGSLKNIC